MNPHDPPFAAARPGRNSRGDRNQTRSEELATEESMTAGARQLPLVEELAGCPDVMDALRRVSDLPGVILLESALHRGSLGRYSFLAADPFETVRIDKAGFGTDPFATLRARLNELNAEPVPDLPPFQGGAAGLLSYELGAAWERLPAAQHNEFALPDLCVGLYDWVIAWDHAQQRAWIISHGFPERDAAARTDRAARRLQAIRRRLAAPRDDAAKRARSPMAGEPLPADALAPQWPAPGPAGLTSNFTREAYLKGVERVIDYIVAGDVFQVNLSQRLLAPFRGSPLELYERLRRVNPAPFAGYLAADDFAVASASPERFLSMRGGEVETRPIKGTRKRKAAPEADLFTRDELRESIKDQAENVMIVDLLRNDLSRVCAPGSIHVPQLCAVETYETVQHLVSEIRGRLAPERNAWDLFECAFPGGSITGAPKIRSMEIIAELEPTARGAYCGSLFYVGFDGACDSSVLIRTFTCRRGWLQCPVGGGIVAGSDPQLEYEETLHKAEGMLRALNAPDDRDRAGVQPNE